MSPLCQKCTDLGRSFIAKRGPEHVGVGLRESEGTWLAEFAGWRPAGQQSESAAEVKAGFFTNRSCNATEVAIDSTNSNYEPSKLGIIHKAVEQLGRSLFKN
jgi:hypothetical protein